MFWWLHDGIYVRQPEAAPAVLRGAYEATADILHLVQGFDNLRSSIDLSEIQSAVESTEKAYTNLG